jgi:hypothetical protein
MPKPLDRSENRILKRWLAWALLGLSFIFSGRSFFDEHPADILRGYLAAYSVELLSFDGCDKWAKMVESETEKDPCVIG